MAVTAFIAVAAHLPYGVLLPIWGGLTLAALAAAAFLSAEVISRWGRGLTGMIVILLTAIHAVAAGGSFPAV